MNYIDKIVRKLEGRMPGNDPALLRLYALLVCTKGKKTTRRNVHDAWAAWRTATKPEHPSLVPFGDLSPAVRKLDGKYVSAIREVREELEREGFTF